MSSTEPAAAVFTVPAPLLRVEANAVARFLSAMRARQVAYALREHEHARHARHLAALWDVPLHTAGRATLFYADGAPVLVLVPADRKIDAPGLRRLLGVADLRVLRADRGVGRAGWANLPGEPGVLPALPALYAGGARSLVDPEVLDVDRLVVALDPGLSIQLGPADYAALCGSDVQRVIGRTRLLPEGGMVDEPAAPE